MRSFNFVVTGCHNCPHNDKDTWCRKAGLDTPEEYQALSIQNYFILTNTCPEYSKSKLSGWIPVSDGLPDLEFVDAAWCMSRQCLISDGKDVMIAWLNANEYGILWQGAKEYRIDEITHWKYTDLP